MTKTKTCTVCDIDPALGVGNGKIKVTCAACIGKLVSEGTCPSCRGVGAYSPEHVVNCTGKKPPKPKAEPKRKKPDPQTAKEILKEIGASERLSDRRKAAEARKAMTPEQRSAYRKELEEAARVAKEGATGTDRRTDPEGVEPEEVPAVEPVAEAGDLPRCEACHAFLADNGKCANDECPLVGAS